eukprot:1111580-Prymnesium_polylepis.1
MPATETGGISHRGEADVSSHSVHAPDVMDDPSVPTANGPRVNGATSSSASHDARELRPSGWREPDARGVRISRVRLSVSCARTISKAGLQRRHHHSFTTTGA